jgi:hypothetical protein
VIKRRISFIGGAFGELHRARLGPLPDLSGLDAEQIPAALLEKARVTWQDRARSEFRSIQILSRLLTEVAGAGDPLDVYALVTQLIDDDIHHTELCAAVCAALGAPAFLPEPVTLNDSAGFLASPMAERALATAISMLGINETISVGYIADLAGRCGNPAIKAVLDAIRGGEAQHQELGWSYIRQALRRFPAETSPDWRHLVKVTLQPHEAFAARTLEPVPANQHILAAWPEPELAELGLLSHERQALIFHRTWVEVLKPRLAELELLPV